MSVAVAAVVVEGREGPWMDRYGETGETERRGSTNGTEKKKKKKKERERERERETLSAPHKTKPCINPASLVQGVGNNGSDSAYLVWHCPTQTG